MSQNTLKFGARTVEISHPEKEFFPDAELTKADLVDYYRRIADVMVPHLRNRPLVMHRYPDGLGDGGFVQQECPDYFPDWVDRVTVDKKTGGSVTHALCNNAATLVYLANQACTTPHVWLSRCDRPRYPDRIIFDLDPPEDDFEPVRRAALDLKESIESEGLAPFVMTTGSRGLHVLIPVRRDRDFDAIRDWAGTLAQKLADRHPDRLTTEQRKEKRGNRLFLDILRNAYGQTAVAPYAVRMKPGAPVATPLDWDELGDRTLHPRRYTVGNIFRRLGQKSDPWEELIIDN
ncbi:MAG: non-homologous end-joining DNA ligase [Limnospira sp.]